MFGRLSENEKILIGRSIRIFTYTVRQNNANLWLLITSVYIHFVYYFIFNECSTKVFVQLRLRQSPSKYFRLFQGLIQRGR